MLVLGQSKSSSQPKTKKTKTLRVRNDFFFPPHRKPCWTAETVLFPSPLPDNCNIKPVADCSYVWQDSWYKPACDIVPYLNLIVADFAIFAN